MSKERATQSWLLAGVVAAWHDGHALASDVGGEVEFDDAYARTRWSTLRYRPVRHINLLRQSDGVQSFLYSGPEGAKGFTRDDGFRRVDEERSRSARP